MKDHVITAASIQPFMAQLQEELQAEPVLLVTTQGQRTGKWGMARLWRSWMATTADWMAARGVKMPLALKRDGTPWGEREFNSQDAHDLFTAQWLGVDSDGKRLSWSRSGREGMRAATKGERYDALRKHEAWSIEKGIALFQPRDSEYRELSEAQNA